MLVLLSEKCRSGTFFYSHFKKVMFDLQFRYQGTANKVFFYSLQNKSLTQQFKNDQKLHPQTMSNYAEQ